MANCDNEFKVEEVIDGGFDFVEQMWKWKVIWSDFPKEYKLISLNFSSF